MKQTVATLCAVILMVGCRSEGNHSARTNLVNNTGVEINITQYSQSQKSAEVYIIGTNQNLSVVENGGRGKSSGYSLATEISFYDCSCYF